MIRFFLRRFVIVLVIALVVLGAFELQTSDGYPDWSSVAFWSFAAAALSAAAASWTARHRACRI